MTPRCPMCGAGAPVRFELPHTPVRECQASDCGLVYCDRQPSASQLRDHYATLYYPANTEHSPQKLPSDLAKLQQHFDALNARIGLTGKRIVDVGCGIGNFLEVAGRSGAGSVVGIETSDDAACTARQRGFHVVARQVDLQPASFDLLYLNDVIEHLREPWQACRELSTLLVPGGHIFVATVHMDGLKGRLLGARWDMLRDPTHFYFFTAASLARLLKTAGFCEPSLLRFPVTFSHHGALRRGIQRGLVALGLDSSLKMIATRDVEEHA